MNFSPAFAFKSIAIVVLALLAGCGQRDGVKELDLGREAYDLHDLTKAEKYLTKCLDYAPENVDAIVYLARIKLEVGEISAARDYVARAQGLAPDAVDVRTLAAQLAWHAKDYTAAARGFASLADDAKLDAQTRSLGWTGLGIVEMTCNNKHLARIDFLRATRIDRRNASAWYHLGLLYRDAFGYLEAARDQLEFFVRLEKVADLRVQKAQRTLIPAIKETIARELANRPGVGNRDSSACSASLAKAEEAWKKGLFLTARQAYIKALAADPLSYPAALGLAKAWPKTDSSKAGLQKSFDNYRLACTLNPGAISTFITTGELAEKLGRYAEAQEIYSRAVAASPTSASALDGLIRALGKVGKNQRIARAYQDYRDFAVLRKKK